MQPTKLGLLYDNIDWSTCGVACKQLPLAQQLWSTKWLTNWLPTSQNMVRWGMWMSDSCPSCNMVAEDTKHLLTCLDPGRIEYVLAQIPKIKQNLISKQIPLPAVALMLHVLFPQRYPLQVGLTPPKLLLGLQTTISEQKWGLPSLFWHQYLEIFNPDPTKQHRTRHWLATLLQQLWNTA